MEPRLKVHPKGPFTLIAGPAHVVQCVRHSDAMCSRA